MKTYTGTGSAQSITTDFSPDLVWIKRRDAAGNYHHFFDRVRGDDKVLYLPETFAEDPFSNFGFNSDGFTISGSANGTNASSNTYVSWNWDAGSSNSSVSAGGLNSSAYDQSETWSDGGTSATAAFDGNLASGGWTGNYTWTNPQTTNITPTSQVRIRVFAYDYDNNDYGTFKVNGTAQTTTNGANHWHTVNGITWDGSTSLDTIEISSGGGTGTNIEAVEVDGKLLVDDTVTMANVPLIASTERVNNSAGFSIVTYTGDGTNKATVAHGLNAAPDMIIVKSRSGAYEWPLYHSTLTPDETLFLHLTNQPNSASAINAGGIYSVDSLTYTCTNGNSNINNTNASGATYVAYCWTEVEGFSKFGNFTGNGIADGTFIYCGFTPRWIMIKQAHPNYGGSWVIYDTVRTPTNSGENWIYHTTAGEAAAATYAATVTSNGFKMRSTSAENNGSGRNYVFAAFAESPFKYSNAK